MSYKFDPKTEYPTVKIQVQPNRYVAVYKTSVGSEPEKVMLSPRRKVELDPADGKRKIVWDFEPAEMWVPARIATELTKGNEKSKAGAIMPVARILETRAQPSLESPVPSKRRPAGGSGDSDTE